MHYAIFSSDIREMFDYIFDDDFTNPLQEPYPTIAAVHRGNEKVLT